MFGFEVAFVAAGEDLVQFLLGFRAAFPEHANRDILLASESYGGHYAPAWTGAVLDYNAAQAAAGGATLPLVGVLIGNGITLFLMLAAPSIALMMVCVGFWGSLDLPYIYSVNPGVAALMERVLYTHTLIPTTTVITSASRTTTAMYGTPIRRLCTCIVSVC